MNYGLPSPRLVSFPDGQRWAVPTYELELVGAEPAGFAPAYGVPATVGAEPVGQPPHASDWWISPDDVLDYANWLDGEMEKIDHEVIYNWPSSQELLPAYLTWVDAFEPIWSEWHYNWRAYLAELRGSWIARNNAWDTVKGWHAELVRRAQAATKLGLPHAPIVGVPEEPLKQPGGGILPPVTDTLADIAKIVIPVALVGGVIYLIATTRKT